jgi:hypothetical protein
MKWVANIVYEEIHIILKEKEEISYNKDHHLPINYEHQSILPKLSHLIPTQVLPRH